jgi:two-component system, NtrC family, response regulator HydG
MTMAGSVGSSNGQVAETRYIASAPPINYKHTMLTANTAIARLLGRGQAMQRVRARIERVARSPVPVLIQGETGTGKELFAAAIVELSGNTRYIAVNCAAVSESLIDSELFGHTRGAFTGATQDRKGLVAAAHGGTLFLDELAEIPLQMQVKLLRTLESGEYRPVGATAAQQADFRILAATSADIDEVVNSGRIRQDLVHRLGAVRIRMPPLRERPEDLDILAQHFLSQYRARTGHGPTRVAAAAQGVLLRHSWPGNVRELRNVVFAAAAFAGTSDTLEECHVLEIVRIEDDDRPSDRLPTLAEALQRAASIAIASALSHTRGHRARAAEILGISEASLYRRLAR